MLTYFTLSILLVLQQRTAEPIASDPTGLEWMVVATILVPAILLIIITYVGSRHTV